MAPRAIKALNIDGLKRRVFAPIRQRYQPRDTILYALGVGAGHSDAPALNLVYEKQLQALPTLATTLCIEQADWLREEGVDLHRLLHGEQYLRLHRPLPAAAEVIATLAVVEIVDHGPGRDAVIYLQRELSDAAGGELLATVGLACVYRGGGGIPAGSSTASATPPWRLGAVPPRAPDGELYFATRSDQALLYRLSGDYNPLHIDPDFARSAGFDRPILHGLCTYGIAGRLLIEALCAGDPHRLRQCDARFSGPVLPGDTLRLQWWQLREGAAAFRCEVDGRVVLDHGFAAWR